MEHTYKIKGMTCSSCLQKVTNALNTLESISIKSISLNPAETTLKMEHHIPTGKINEAVGKAGNYSLEEKTAETVTPEIIFTEESKAVTYKPLILILGYLLGFVIVSQVREGELSWMNMMSNFMGGFFVVFSFFKFLDLKGFAYSYSSYDIVAKKWPGYGFVYPFIELALGVAYLANFEMLITSWVTLIVMGISTIGVLQSVLRKKKIQCACLGTVFNLPMSTVTLVEDTLMVLMAAGMVIYKILN